MCVCVCARACVRFAYVKSSSSAGLLFPMFWGRADDNFGPDLGDLKVFDSESAERISSGNEFHSTM